MSKSSNSKYEDNPDFCAERYGESENVSKEYLKNYKKAFSNILISKGNVKLCKFSTYKEKV